MRSSRTSACQQLQGHVRQRATFGAQGLGASVAVRGTNAYRAAWKSGEVLSDPEAVYARIKVGESREEREVRVDGEHASLTKGRLTGHQFEPLFVDR